MSILENVKLQGASEYLFRVEEVTQMADLGLFPEPGRVELIDGRLIMSPSEGALHMAAGSRLLLILAGCISRDPALEAAFDLSGSGTLRLGDYRLTSPDVLVVPKLDGVHLPTGPDVVLAVEVAVSSRAYDEGVKRSLYAEAGVAELWIVEPEPKRVLVCRQPSGQAYAQVEIVGEGGALVPPFAPDQPIPLSALF